MKLKRKDLIKIIEESFANLPDDYASGRDLDYSHPSEGSHAKKHLFHASVDAIELHDLLQDEDNIPTWCLEYLAIARHGIGVVKDYLSYKINNKH